MIWRLYNIFIRLMIVALKGHALLSHKSKLAVKGRKSIPIFAKKQNKRVIIHCASLGEYEQAKPIIQKCKDENIEVVLTFFSPSGYEQLKDNIEIDYVEYLPFDLEKNILPFLRAADPDFLIFIKYEFWWNIVRSEYPIFFVSVVLRPEHYIFKSWAKPFLQELKMVEQIFLIDEPSFNLLKNNGFTNIQLSGDTRIESILNRKQQSIKDSVIEKFCANENVLIFGSTYPIEHSEIIKIHSDLQEDFKLLIFPHEIDQKEISTLKESLGKDAIVYSRWVDRPVFTGHSTMIVDKVGLLKDAYRFGDIAYIGGGFSHGIHNLLEPFVYQLPLVFGPEYQKFPEAKLLAEQTFVKVISSIHDLGAAIKQLQESDYLDSLKEVYNRIFILSDGASTIIMKQLRKELWNLTE